MNKKELIIALKELIEKQEARPKTYVYTEGRFSEEFYDIYGLHSSCTKDELIAMILMMKKYWKVIE